MGESGTYYTKPWLWMKGNRVSLIGDSLNIKIGGENFDKKARQHVQTNRIKSTKYSLITFVPQNLLEQFRRIANFYFLCMTVISIIIDSPVSPLTSLLPLTFVIAVTAAKQGYENFLRYRADNMVNYSLVTVIRNGVEQDIKCQDVSQGDLVAISRDCDVPCDLVLLKSADEGGKCHITTANLDGETNLKTLQIPKGLPNLPTDKLHTLGRIECEHPRVDLYTFNGRIELSPSFGRNRMTILGAQPEDSSTLPLMADNLLLRGSRVKNTEWAIGCAVYTGQNTKLALNSRITSNKTSSSETYINKFLVFFLVLLIAAVTLSYFLKRYYDTYQKNIVIYIGETVARYKVAQFLQDYFSFLILFNYMIPISLYVTIEMHKFLGSFFLEWDFDLYDEETDQPCIVNTSDLNEELGQVSILFSDKTGTLTKNEMIFKQCSINGKKYNQNGNRLREDGRTYSLKVNQCSSHVYNFFETLSLCHTVQVAGDYVNEKEDEVPEEEEVILDEYVLAQSEANQFDNIIEECDLNAHPETELDEPYSNRANLLNDTKLICDKKGDFLNPLLKDLGKVNFRHTISDEKSSQLNNLSLNNNKLENVRPSSENIFKSGSKLFTSDNKVYPFEANRQSVAPRPHSLYDTTVESNRDTQTKLDRILFSTGSGNNLQRSLVSLELKRTISAYEEKKQVTQMTHRRVQSYVPAGSFKIDSTDSRRASGLSSARSSGKINRRSTAREYYAAPSYTEASLIERHESLMKAKEVSSFIDKLDYQASSPDEKALVEVCAQMGLVYVGSQGDKMNLKLRTSCVKKKKDEADVEDEILVQYERFGVLQFTSDRKRMSVIIKDKNGQLWLYTKGAESHVLPLCTKTSANMIMVTQRHINDFAREGLRTLAVARKRITQTELAIFNNEVMNANNSLTDRVTKVEECQRKIETGLELLGATAVEDALQDNVKDTLESLRIAGIKVWVLTGDKVETALNIALSCGHIPHEASKYFITECNIEQQILEHFEAFSWEMHNEPDKQYALLIDGISLATALKFAAEKFRDMAMQCRAVLCCRLSPLQKCEVVQLMKTVEGTPITAAIGDGANDVSMIQEAHVGLGIVGKEGRQAARCADYAFANFSMAKKLILVHGHYFSVRLAILVLYFFYKNLIFMGIQVYFQMHSMFSSQSVYDSLFLTLYNVIYTALPVLVLSLTEKQFSVERLMSEPHLYRQIAGNKAYAWKYFVGWMALATYHSVIIYAFSYIVWERNPVIYSYKPYTVSLSCFGTIMIHNVVIVANLKLLLEAVHKNYVFIASILLSVFGFMGTTFIYNLFNINYDGDMLLVYNNLLSCATFWLLSTLILVATLLPDYFMKASRALNIKFGRVFPGNELYNRKLFQKHKAVQTTYL